MVQQVSKQSRIFFAALFLFLITIALCRTSNAEEEQLISNSANWRDVYSALLYASLTGKDSNFLVSNRHATLLLNTLDYRKKNVMIVSSSKNPYIFGYKDIVASKGFNVQEYAFSDFNIELAKMLTNVTKFIIVDDSYGYNAISVAPYAVITNSYVLFANRQNINTVTSFLSTRKIDSIIIYGHVAREVTNALKPYNPEIINYDGDRFANNIEIVKRYQKIKPSKQAIFTNGEFIEKEIMSGVTPVIFIGIYNVPDIVKNYIQESDLEVGVLIGNELIGTATYVRRQTGLSVFAKFARSARAPESAISPVEGLDIFYLPRYILNLSLYSITYNKATGQLEVTYKNEVNLATYFKGIITLRDSAGNVFVVGDETPLFIEGNEYKTIIYQINTTLQGNITADLYTLYGESKNSLERVLQITGYPVGFVEVFDSAEINITEMVYDARRKVFMIKLTNIGKVKAYARVELVDLVINNERITFGSKLVELEPKESKWVDIPVDLSEEDYDFNQIVNVNVYYGERPNALVKFIKANFEFRLRGFDYLYYGTTLLIVVLIILILIALLRKKCLRCKHRNWRWAKHCKNCGYEFR